MSDKQQPTTPWWKVGPMWLVVLGPVIVIIAAVVTLFIALRVPDPVITEDYYRKGLELSKMKPQDVQMMPAIQARNHAATPKPDAPAAEPAAVQKP